MSIEVDFLEGTTPAIRPNAGHHVLVHWTDRDRRQFSDALRRKFPNVIFYERFTSSDNRNKDFKPRFAEHLDETTPGKPIVAVFPPPAWRPELFFVSDPQLPYWTWKNYLSPIISLMPRPEPDNPTEPDNWMGDAADNPIREWRGTIIQTSYRREVDVERRIQAAVLRLAVRLSRQLLPVRWDSHADYCKRNGKIVRRWLSSWRIFASQSVLDWKQAGPRREIYMSVSRGERDGLSWYAPEDVPEAWWGDVPKPKWVQAALRSAAQKQHP